jgi:hypothetical protein
MPMMPGARDCDAMKLTYFLSAAACFLMMTSGRSESVFSPSPSGFIRHWLVKGPLEKPYTGPSADEHVLRRDALDYGVPTPPSEAMAGQVWRLHDPGRNEFVEFSRFYKELTVVEWWAYTTLDVEKGGSREALLWAAGAVDLWVNDKPVARLNVTRYRNPDSKAVSLPLGAGENRICVRLQCLGVRDTRLLFGLDILDPSGVKVRVPGVAKSVAALAWMDEVKGAGNTGLIARNAAPDRVKVVAENGREWPWPQGATELSFCEERPRAVSLQVEAEESIYQRRFEFPENRAASAPAPSDRREAHLRYVAKAGLNGETPSGWNARILPLMARRMLGMTTPADGEAFADALALIDARRDCADFAMAGLLRMEKLGLLRPDESKTVHRAAIGFRYWTDESGQDAMCFYSENHSLLFHGCQLIAGRLYPDEVFPASGRTGREQAAVALGRIREWLDKIEARGFEEFNSGTYMPITIAAMLNVVDFCDDKELAGRMAAQVDRIFRDLARHAFGGGIISPQGRVYRDVLFPEESGVEALLAYATDATDVDLAGPRPGRERTGDWVVFPASSVHYRPPEDLAILVRAPQSLTYRNADVQIILEKTRSYALTSLAIPSVPRDGEHPTGDLRPGGAGYQQHLWQATLGPDCHVFANHPGGFFDGTLSRPGYWNGNGVLPRVRQEGRWLQAIYVIPDGSVTEPPMTPAEWEWAGPSSRRPFDRHQIPFVHLYWPGDVFDRQVHKGNWLFAQKGEGLIGVWCSVPLVAHDEVLTGREWRANSHASAWLVICGDTKQDGSIEKFMADCESRHPVFDTGAYVLGMQGTTPTRWWERSEPMPTGPKEGDR